MSDLVSTSDFAAMAGIAQSEVRSLIRVGELPATEVGGKWVISLSALEDENPSLYERLVESDEGDDEDDGDAEDEEDDLDDE